MRQGAGDLVAVHPGHDQQTRPARRGAAVHVEDRPGAAFVGDLHEGAHGCTSRRCAKPLQVLRERHVLEDDVELLLAGGALLRAPGEEEAVEVPHLGAADQEGEERRERSGGGTR